MEAGWQQRLLAFDDPDLDPGERAELEALLDTQPGAREYLCALRLDRERFIEAFSAVQAHDGFTEQVMGRLPARRRAWLPFGLPRLMEVCAAGLAVMVAASLFSPARFREQERRAICESSMKDLTRAIMAYAQDYDEMLPAGTQFLDKLAEVSNGRLSVHCPSDTDPARASYAMPMVLAGAALPKLRSQNSQVLLFDADGPFLAPRHERGANVGFLDGSVRFVRQGDVQRANWQEP